MAAVLGIELGAHPFGEIVDLVGRARFGEVVADDLKLGHRAGGVIAERIGDVRGGGAGVNEFDFRYNTRDLDDFARAELALKGIEGKRLTYRRTSFR